VYGVSVTNNCGFIERLYYNYNKLLQRTLNLDCRGFFSSCFEANLILRPTVSRPVSLGIKHPSGAYDQIFITVGQLRVCWYGSLSLRRGCVCRLQLLLVLASEVILGSESRGTRDHNLLFQIWYFPFCCLLRLAGLRWRYSTPPPLGFHHASRSTTLVINSHEPNTEHSIQQYMHSSVVILVSVVTVTHVRAAMQMPNSVF
jgi:hypothetical protein